jgi:hypothetical protein
MSTADHGEAGSVTLWLMVMVLAMFAAIGLVFDGGRALALKGTAISDAYGRLEPGPRHSIVSASLRAAHPHPTRPSPMRPPTPFCRKPVSAPAKPKWQ